MSTLTQKEKILLKLQDHGEDGVSNYELFDIAFRYPARINELRRDGYNIQSVHVAGSQWRFILDE